MRLWPLIIVCLPAACNDQEVATATATPQRQFVFEGLKIQERKAGKLVWEGTARRADGDLSESDVEDVKLTCIANDGNGRPYDVLAPRAHLALDRGLASFEAVRIVDAEGAELRATRADYDEAKGTIVAAGPLTFTARGFAAHATAATVTLATGQVDITGPVEGRFDKPGATRPRP